MCNGGNTMNRRFTGIIAIIPTVFRIYTSTSTLAHEDGLLLHWRFDEERDFRPGLLRQ